MIETNISKRWENGILHHVKSIELYNAIADIDFKYGNDYFNFKSGGDGDNGEHLMYLLDIYIEMLAKQNEDQKLKIENHID